MKESKSTRVVCIVLTILAIGIVFVIDQIIKPGYLIKSIVKVASFGGTVLLYAALTGSKIKDAIDLHKPKKIGVLLGFIALFFAGIAVLSFLLRNRIAWAGIRESLVEREGLTKENCFFVFAYIIIVNSFLEEAFFRGFLPKLFGGKRAGWIISAVLFSVYHIGIIVTWFNIPIFLLCVVGLALVGGFLQWLCIRYKTIVADWMVHASANIAINVIGTLLIFNILE